ncbi:hypothetical protein OY671_006422 [Metschnikowia pulcherrima]|nr:hypothetical protein OY671_006422 [Metschnikowia pulcherrima]
MIGFNLIIGVIATISATKASSIKNSYTTKLYEQPVPVSFRAQQNRFLSIPEAPFVLKKGTDSIQIHAPPPLETFVWNLVGYYVAEISGEHIFTTGKTEKAFIRIGPKHVPLGNPETYDPNEMEVISDSNVIKYLQAGLYYPVKITYISGTEKVPVYITTPDGVKKKLKEGIRQIGHMSESEAKSSTAPGTGSFASISDSESESESNPVIQAVETGFLYSIYVVPAGRSHKSVVRDFSELALIEEGFFDGVSNPLGSLSVTFPFIQEIVGHIKPPRDDEYKTSIRNALIGNLQVGPGAEGKEGRYIVDDTWTVVDTRLDPSGILKLESHLYYPFRLVVITQTKDTPWAVESQDSSVTKIDLFEFSDVSEESDPSELSEPESAEVASVGKFNERPENLLSSKSKESVYGLVGSNFEPSKPGSVYSNLGNSDEVIPEVIPEVSEKIPLEAKNDDAQVTNSAIGSKKVPEEAGQDRALVTDHIPKGVPEHDDLVVDLPELVPASVVDKGDPDASRALPSVHKKVPQPENNTNVNILNMPDELRDVKAIGLDLKGAEEHVSPNISPALEASHNQSVSQPEIPEIPGIPEKVSPLSVSPSDTINGMQPAKHGNTDMEIQPLNSSESNPVMKNASFSKNTSLDLPKLVGKPLTFSKNDTNKTSEDQRPLIPASQINDFGTKNHSSNGSESPKSGRFSRAAYLKNTDDTREKVQGSIFPLSKSEMNKIDHKESGFGVQNFANISLEASLKIESACLTQTDCSNQMPVKNNESKQNVSVSSEKTDLGEKISPKCFTGSSDCPLGHATSLPEDKENRATSQNQDFNDSNKFNDFHPNSAKSLKPKDSQNPSNLTDPPVEHALVSSSSAGTFESENSMKMKVKSLPIYGPQSNLNKPGVSLAEKENVKIHENSFVPKSPESFISLGQAANVPYEGAAPSSKIRLFDCDSVFVWSLICFVLISV